MSGLPEYVRVFTAVELDPEIRDALAAEAADLLHGAGRVTRVPLAAVRRALKVSYGKKEKEEKRRLGTCAGQFLSRTRAIAVAAQICGKEAPVP